MQDNNASLFDGALAEVSEQLSEMTEGLVSVVDKNITFEEMGVTSVNLLALLVALENKFGIEWSVDTPTEVFNSPDSLCSYIQEQLGG